jgi:hypothetical protein
LELVLYGPDGERFKSYEELQAERNLALQQAQQAMQQAQQAMQQVEQERRRAELLAQRLRESGIDPET